MAPSITKEAVVVRANGAPIVVDEAMRTTRPRAVGQIDDTDDLPLCVDPG